MRIDKLFLLTLMSMVTTSAIGQSKVWTLEDCINYAIENSITVKDAELTKTNSEVTLTSSQMQRLPNLTGSASQSFTNGTSIDPITSDYVNQQINSTSVGLNSSVTLFQGFQTNNQIAQNKLLVNQNSLYVEEAKNSITLSIVEAYLQALYNQEALEVAQQNLNSSEKEVERSQANFEAGNLAKKDLLDAQSQAASNKYSLISAQTNYEQQMLTLKQLLELQPEDAFEIQTPDDEFEGTIVPNKMEVYQQALEIMPEINASEMNIEINEKDVSIARGGYLPTLSLSGSLGSGYTSTQDLSFADQMDLNYNQRLGLSLSIPIFNRYSTKAQVQTAQINIQKAQLNLISAEKELYQKIETAWQNARAAQEQLLSAKVARDAALSAYELAQQQHELGAMSTIDLVVSQNTYTAAEQTYIQAKYLSILYTQLLAFYQGNDIKL
ncbi:MAG: hypothetical protein CL843_04100 [Crocinitomicaceae bacterium]|nr:hypothetical protein [Crocinitomicaceae bacterium]